MVTIFSDHNEIKLIINNRMITNIWKLNKILLNNTDEKSLKINYELFQTK